MKKGGAIMAPEEKETWPPPVRRNTKNRIFRLSYVPLARNMVVMGLIMVAISLGTERILWVMVQSRIVLPPALLNHSLQLLAIKACLSLIFPGAISLTGGMVLAIREASEQADMKWCIRTFIAGALVCIGGITAHFILEKMGFGGTKPDMLIMRAAWLGLCLGYVISPCIGWAEWVSATPKWEEEKH